MSIYCTRLDTEMDDAGQVIAYDGSHLQPDPSAGRGCHVDTAHIPGFCVPGFDDNTSDHPCAPWLRLGVGASGVRATVLIDETAARALAADLLDWADTPKVAPR